MEFNSYIVQDTNLSLTMPLACPPPRKPRCSKVLKAFTLAEILIALTIIGVVASLTIPNLISQYQEQVTISKVKKFYNTMNNATTLAARENGTLDTWNIQSSTDLMAPIVKYLKIKKDCGVKQNSGCISNETYYLNGNFYYNYDGSNYAGGYYKIILENGETLWARWFPEQNCNTICGELWYDLNGTKKPNTYGKDIFAFFFYKDHVKPDPQNDCNKNKPGWGCAKHIILNSNMDYLH